MRSNSSDTWLSTVHCNMNIASPKKIVQKCVFSFNKNLKKTSVLNIADTFDYSVIK